MFDVGDVLVSVDPGSVSGWAVMTIEAAPRVVRCGKVDFTTPRRREFRTASAVIQWATTGHEVELVVIEDQYFDQDDPKKIASTIKLCRSAGRWVEGAEVYGIQHKMLNPTQWQTAMLGARMRREQLKIFSRRICAQRFGVDAPDHISDAILLGAYTAVEIHSGLAASELPVVEASGGARAGQRPGRRGRTQGRGKGRR
jgi:Holliday junction resolvasome RuvABC endonuclease subunit